MSSARDPEDILASIRRLVAREVSEAQAKENAERAPKADIPVFSSRASSAARLVLKSTDPLAANGDLPENSSHASPEASDRLSQGAGQGRRAPQAEAPSVAAPQSPAPGPLSYMTEDELRTMIRDIFREEVRTRMGPRINDNIRKIVQIELAKLFSEDE